MTECQEMNYSEEEEQEQQKQQQQQQEQQQTTANMSCKEAEPSHHARRPMNAFLIFCKRHRSVVRDKHPNLENRSITKILGEWWAHIGEDEKACYQGLAKEYKDAYLLANPEFRWYKLPAPPLRNNNAQKIPHTSTGGIPSDHDAYHSLEMQEVKVENTNNNHLIKYEYMDKPSTSAYKHANVKQGKKPMITPGKLADEAHMGGISSLIIKSEDDANKDLNYRRSHMSFNSSESSSKYSSSSKNSSFRYTKCGTPNQSALEDIPPQTSTPLSDEDKRLQEALTETTRSFEMNSDKSNDSSVSNDKSNSPIEGKDAFRNYDSDDTYSGHNASSKREIGESSYLKHQSSLSSDESQEKYYHPQVNENRPKSIFYIDPNMSKTSERSCKGKKYKQYLQEAGFKGKRQKKDLSKKNMKLSRVGEGNPSRTYIAEYSSTVTSNKMERSTDSHLPDDYNMCNASAYKLIKNEPNDAGQTSFDYEDNLSDHGEPSEGPSSKMYTASDFGLEAKIQALPSLSYEKFQERKKEMKTKRRNVTSSKSNDTKRTSHMSNIHKYYPQVYNNNEHSRDQIIEAARGKHQNIINHESRMMLAQQKKSEIIGSKKRKLRKGSINRIDVNSQQSTNDNVNNNVSTKPLFISNCTKVIPSTSVIDPAIVQANNNNNDVLMMDTNNATATSDLGALETLAEVAAKKSKID